MKFTRKWLALLVVLFLTTANAAENFDVELPDGWIDPVKMAVPVGLYLNYGSVYGLDIDLSSEKSVYMKINAVDGQLVREISTRFMVDSDVLVISNNSHLAKKKKVKAKFNLSKSPLPRPFQLNSVDRKLGKQMVTFSGGDITYIEQKGNGVFKVLFKQAASISKYLQSVTIKFANKDATQTLIVYGSPYWFEPLINFKGDFDTAEIVRIELFDSNNQQNIDTATGEIKPILNISTSNTKPGKDTMNTVQSGFDKRSMVVMPDKPLNIKRKEPKRSYRLGESSFTVEKKAEELGCERKSAGHLLSKSNQVREIYQVDCKNMESVIFQCAYRNCEQIR